MSRLSWECQPKSNKRTTRTTRPKFLLEKFIAVAVLYIQYDFSLLSLFFSLGRMDSSCTCHAEIVKILEKINRIDDGMKILIQNQKTCNNEELPRKKSRRFLNLTPESSMKGKYCRNS